MSNLKILIANRGEIACRIIKTLKSMGFTTVSIYSDADKFALHVLISDESYYIGPPEPLQSYLDMEKIIYAAKKSGASYIHPGYGFLSENHEFSELCLKNNIKFIGPSPESMRLMGDKMEAKRVAEKLGIPTIPGSKTGFTNSHEALEFAKNIGFPVMLKAQLGGGGKGMRIVEREEDFLSLFNLSMEETRKAFGDDRIFIEKFIKNPKHVEIQILGDEFGNVFTFEERECSIQRRYQKIIEESTSPGVNERIRKELMECAYTLAKYTNYYSLGTVEFLLDENGKFYFLEVNARLQVEHPITEMRYNLDLVREQVRVALGERLTKYAQNPTGHAIEARINAEDPFNNFFPTFGKIEFLLEPGGPGIRVDSGVYQGFEVPMHYDPLISKLIVFGKSRNEAILKLKNSLNIYQIIGIQTNIPFLLRVTEHPQFLDGSYTTNFLKNFAFEEEEPLGFREVSLISLYKHNERSSLNLEKPEVKEGVSDWRKAFMSTYKRVFFEV